MAITVQHIIDLPVLKNAKVITGKKQLQKQQVEWMTATEGPVKDLVRQDEIILTTGVACSNAEDLLNFVKDVCKARAAALAIATGEYIKEIPKEVIQYAEKQQFILIELPWSVRFTDIQRETTKAINKIQQKHIEEAQQMQDRLIDFVLQGKQLIDLINYVENELKCSIVFTDHYGRIISPSIEKPETIIRLWDEFVSEQKIITEKIDTLIAEIAPYKNGYLLKKEIATNIDQIGDGYFIVILRDRNELYNGALQTVESLAAAAAVWLSREDAIVRTELKLKNQFIWELAKMKNVVLEEKTQTRANLFGFQLDIPYVCIVGYSNQFEVGKIDENDEQQINHKPVIHDVEEKIRKVASMMNKQVAFTLDEDYLIMFLEANDVDEHSVHQFIDEVNDELDRFNGNATFSWGIGQHENGIKTFHESYEKAFSALEAVLSQHQPGERFSFEETSLNRLLLYLANSEEINDIIETTIYPLVEYESQRGIDLIHTFSVYDEEKRNVSKAARKLNLHRQSLLYRLKKIEDLTNLAVDKPDDAFVLNLSIRVWQTKTLLNEN